MRKYTNKYICDAFLANFKSLVATKAICLDVALLLVAIQWVGKDTVCIRSLEIKACVQNGFER